MMPSLWKMLLTVAVQQMCIGLMTVSLVQKKLLAAFIFSMALNLAWWMNTGHRIDMHKAHWSAGFLYALVAAASVVFGAWLGWR